MMHQRDESMGCAQCLGGIRQHAEGKAVDHDRRADRQRCQSRPGGRAGIRRGKWKSVAEVDHRGPPAKRRKPFDDAAVIDVAAGRGRKLARHGEHDLPHHNGASYQARATGDSATVTRIDLSSRPSRPSLPLRAASAR